jgi:hypothetical protein
LTVLSHPTLESLTLIYLVESQIGSTTGKVPGESGWTPKMAVFLAVIILGSVVWVGLDHRTTRERYGYDIINRDAVWWVGACLLLWVIVFPSYLWQRRRQRRHPMWPYPDGRPVDLMSDAGVYWHRGPDGAWAYYDETVGWRSVPINKMPNGMRLGPIELAADVEYEEIEVASENIEWRQVGSEWEFLGADGNWYAGDGPQDLLSETQPTNDYTWRQTPDGRWQFRGSDGNWYFGDPQATSAQA